MHDLQHLVDLADDAALLRAVDGLVAGGEWDALSDLARRCRDAVELGRQLWGVATHIDYRLALEGPPEHAGAVVRSGAGRFALGPLTEVAASTHGWAALAPHLEDPPARAAVAQERVLRGEDLTGDAGAAQAAPELPLRLADWEPRYALPTYRDRSAEFPQPGVAARALPAAAAVTPARRLPADAAVVALRTLVEAWVTESSGSVDAVAVTGDAAGAVAHLPGAAALGGQRPRAALVAIEPAEALAWLQWTGASGGAHGRRRGGAAGRFAAWWAAAALAGLDWPADAGGLEPFAETLGQAVEELHWFRWSGTGAETGWMLRLAVADPVDGLAWAVEATDQLDDDA